MRKKPLSNKDASTLAMLNAWFGYQDHNVAKAIDRVFPTKFEDAEVSKTDSLAVSSNEAAKPQ